MKSASGESKEKSGVHPKNSTFCRFTGVENHDLCIV